MVLDLIIIAVTSTVQSIFGVGVLLFGTPLLLLRGYGFIDAVIILLPISISINLVQIFRHYRSIDFDFYKKVLVYTIPMVVVFLFLVTRGAPNIGLIIGVFLLFVAAKDRSLRIGQVVKFMTRYEKIYLILMGIVHGLTNLGGSLLTAIVHSNGYEKDRARVTIALSYATFAVFQVLTLIFSGHAIDFISAGVGVYLFVGLSIFTLSERFIYMDIKNEKYSMLFSVFLFLSGIVLCVKSI